MTRQPLVSVVIPVYNGANYLRLAIDSVLAQSYPNVEILVINDGSRDGGATERIARSFGDRIRYFQKANGGVATALNLGIDEMRGEYFSWLSHDDMYAPEKIKRQVDAVLKLGEWAVAYSDFRIISAAGAPLKIVQISPKGPRAMRCLLAFGLGGAIHGCSLLIPRNIFEKYGRFNPDLRCTQDYDLWFRFAGDVTFVHVREILVISRHHAEQGGQKERGRCSREADRLHSRLIGELSNAEIDDYSENSLPFLINAYRTYRSAGYAKTSLRLLKHACRLARERNEGDGATALVNEAIFSNQDLATATHFWRNVYLSRTPAGATRPRIIVYSNVWFRGGIERVIATVVRALNTKYSWIVVSTGTELHDGFPLNDNVLHLRITKAASARLAWQLAAICVLLEGDLFIGHPNIDVDLLPVYELLEGIGVKSVACNHAHYFLPYRYPHLLPLIGQRIEAFGHASAVTWATSFGTSVYSQLAGNSVHLPNPSPFAGSRSLTTPREKLILAVGRFNDAVKRLDRTLEVFARVLVSHPDAVLVVVGGYNLEDRIPVGSKRCVREVLGSLSIPRDRIRFMGETQNVESHYANASLLLLTSESEGFCLTLVEAGVFGLPSVHFEIPGLEDVITDGENGFVVPQNDLDAMAGRVCELLSDPQLRQRMGLRAQELVRRFDQEHICRRWEDLINLVLTVRGQAALNHELGQHFRASTEDSAFTRRAIEAYENNVALLLERGVEATGSSKTPYGLRSLTRRLISSLRNAGVGPTARKLVAKVGRLRNGW